MKPTGLMLELLQVALDRAREIGDEKIVKVLQLLINGLHPEQEVIPVKLTLEPSDKRWLHDLQALTVLKEVSWKGGNHPIELRLENIPNNYRNFVGGGENCNG